MMLFQCNMCGEKIQLDPRQIGAGTLFICRVCQSTYLINIALDPNTLQYLPFVIPVELHENPGMPQMPNMQINMQPNMQPRKKKRTNPVNESDIERVKNNLIKSRSVNEFLENLKSEP